MKWTEVRERYPNQFVKIKILKSHFENNKEIVDEVAVIESVDKGKATKELLASKGDTLVYHTSKEKIILTVRNIIGLRRTK